MPITSGNKYYIHRRWVRKQLLQGDWDWWTAWTGREGSGKSTAEIQAAIFTQQDNGSNRFLKLWRDYIVYDPEGFLNAVDRAPKGMSIVLDEAAEAWYYKEWYEQFHRALDKAAIQMRDRNLDVHLATPRLEYIGRIAQWRINDWCHVKARVANGILRRGYMTMFRHKDQPFPSSKKTPFWEPYMTHRFPPLPRVFYDEYRVFKRAAAQERLGKYIDMAAGRRAQEPDKPSFQQVVREVVERMEAQKDQEPFRNLRGNYDGGLVSYEMNASLEVGRASAKLMQKKMLGTKPKAVVMQRRLKAPDAPPEAGGI